MLIQTESWEARAAAKKASILTKIAPEWRLAQSDLDKADQQRNLTGPFIQQYLDNSEAEIIRQDATVIVEKVRTGHYSAKRVALAFCKCAAVAHQIASSPMRLLHLSVFFHEILCRSKLKLIGIRLRIIAYMKSFLTKQLTEQTL